MDEDILKIVSQSGVTELLNSLDGKGRLKYKDLERIIGNPTTTSRRLNSLEKKGLIARNVSNEKYRPVYYTLTSKGKGLLQLVQEIRETYD